MVSLLGFMALGMPIAFALLACGVALMAYMGSFDTQVLAQNLLEGVNNYPLMAVPFFMLAGELMNAGGLSGRPVFEKSNAVIRQLRAALGAGFPIIGVGGILSGDDAVAKIKAGADVVQIYTGLIYKGPALVKEAALAIRDNA